MKKQRVLLLVSTAFLLLGIFIKNNTHFGFYFDGTIAEHQKWFPRFYILSYLFFKLYIPLFACTVFLLVQLLWEKRMVIVDFWTNKIPVRACFLFVIYISLSWILPEYYPFSKYPMYSSWPDEAFVFSLKDSSNNMIPLRAVSNIDGAELSHVYWSLQGNEVQDSVIGEKMMAFLKKNRHNSSQEKGVFSLSKAILFIGNGKIQTNEIRLYTDTLE